MILPNWIKATLRIFSIQPISICEIKLDEKSQKLHYGSSKEVKISLRFMLSRREKFKFNLHFCCLIKKAAKIGLKREDLGRFYQSPMLLPHHLPSSSSRCQSYIFVPRDCSCLRAYPLMCFILYTCDFRRVTFNMTWHPSWWEERGKINIHSFRIHFEMSVHNLNDIHLLIWKRDIKKQFKFEDVKKK